MKPVVRIILCSVIVLLLAGLLVWAIGFDGKLPIGLTRYDDAAYTIGDMKGETVLTDAVTALDIDWPSSHVTVSSYDGDTVILRETAQENANNRLRYCVENGTLRVRFCKNTVFNFSFGKDLEILLPAAQSLSRIELDLASAEAQLTALKADALDIDTASGDVTATDCTFGSVEVDGASSAFRAERCDIGDFEMDSASGNARLQGSFGAVSYDSASGDLLLVSDIAPRKIEMDTASGSADITVPADAEFRLEFDSASGDLTVDGFAGTSKKDGFLCGSGLAEYSFDSASGDVTFRAGS